MLFRSDLFEDAGAAAAAASAAMSMTLLAEEALALELARVRLGAMELVRSAWGVLCAGRKWARERRGILRRKGTSEVLSPTLCNL